LEGLSNPMQVRSSGPRDGSDARRYSHPSSESPRDEGTQPASAVLRPRSLAEACILYTAGYQDFHSLSPDPGRPLTSVVVDQSSRAPQRAASRMLDLLAK